MSTPLQSIQIQATMPRLSVNGIYAVLHRPDLDDRQVMVDDGSMPGDTPQDGILTASFAGPPVRFVDLELIVRKDDIDHSVFRRVVLVPDAEHASISFFLEQQDSAIAASRVAWLPARGEHAQSGNVVTLTVAFGWGGLCLLYVALLVWLGRRR